MPARRVVWGTGREDAFKFYIEVELYAALAARGALETKWRLWLEQYRAPANQPTKRFPFEGAANFIMPMTAIDVDQLYAKFMQTIHAPANLWTIEPTNPDWTDASKPIQDYLQWLDGAVLHMEDVNKRALLELVKLGTCIYKTDWLYERRTTWAYDGNGGKNRAELVISHPSVDHVRLVDFVIPAYAYAIQADEQGGAPWVAERHRVRVEKLEAIADKTAPYMPNYGAMAVQKIKQWLQPDQTPHDDTIQKLDYNHTGTGTQGGQSFDVALGQATDVAPAGMGNTPKREVEFWEIHARFACSKDGGPEEDLVVEYHLPTRTIIRATYLRYDHGLRPYEKAVYFPSEGFYGIGVCEQKEVFQAIESDLSNYTHDNVLLSNATGLAAKSGGNISAGEPIYPGKLWITDGSPKDELMPFQLGSGAYPGLDRIREQYTYIGRQRTGVSDLNSGNINAIPSRTPATTVQSLLEEGSRRPDLTLKELRNCLSKVGLRIVQLIQQHAQPISNSDGDKVLAAAVSILGQEAGMQVLTKLSMPLQSAEYGIGVNLTATSATANKELAKQALVGLIQMQMQVAPALTQLIMQAMQTWGTPIGQVALDSAQGLAYTLKRLFEQYDIRNLNEVVPTIPKDPVQSISDPLAALQFLPPGSGGPQSAQGSLGMAPSPSPAGAGSPA